MTPGTRSSGHKTRADEPVVSDARDSSASVHENCLHAIASALNQSRHLSVTALADSTVKTQRSAPLSDFPYPTCHFPRNNAPLNLPRSHGKPWRCTQRRDVPPRDPA